MSTSAEQALGKAIKTLLAISPSTEPLLFVVPLRIVPDDLFLKEAGVPEEYKDALPMTAFAGHEKIVFCESFFMKQSPEKQVGLVAHEILHPAFGHLSDPHKDVTLPVAAYHQLRNIAQDIVIESAIARLSKATCNARGPRIEQTYTKKEIGMVEKATGAKWESLGGLDWVTVYHMIRDNAKKIECQEVDIHGTAQGEEHDRIDAQWKAAKQESDAIAAQRGKAKGEAKFEVPVAASSIPWHVVAREWLVSREDPDARNWSRPKRRPFVSRGSYRPVVGFTDRIDAVDIFIDSSGSMYEALSKISGEFKQVASIAEECRLVEYDVGCQRKLLLKQEEVESFSFGNHSGGGGTCLDTAIAELDGDHWEIDDVKINDDSPVLVFTDGFDSEGCYLRLKERLKARRFMMVLTKGAAVPKGIDNVLWLES